MFVHVTLDTLPVMSHIPIPGSSDECPSPGSMVTSFPIEKDKYGTDSVNDGVLIQCSITHAMFEKMGFGASDVEMHVCFGKDAETKCWSNVS